MKTICIRFHINDDAIDSLSDSGCIPVYIAFWFWNWWVQEFKLIINLSTKTSMQLSSPHILCSSCRTWFNQISFLLYLPALFRQFLHFFYLKCHIILFYITLTWLHIISVGFNIQWYEGSFTQYNLFSCPCYQ